MLNNFNPGEELISIPKEHSDKWRNLSDIYYVYIIELNNGESFYIGQTDNLESRWYEHLSNRVQSTKSKIKKLVFFCMCDTREQAVNKEQKFKRIKDSDKKTCFHLHNHTGKAYMNYVMCLESPYVDFCDTSVMSLGKGAGNLKLENVLDDDNSLVLNEFIHKYYESFLL